MADPEHVLRVDRGVVARPAGGDDDLLDAAFADRLGEGADDLGGATQEPGRDLGLFEDLVAQRHPAGTGCPTATGSRPAAGASPARTAASASSEPGRIEYVASAVTPAG